MGGVEDTDDKSGWNSLEIAKLLVPIVASLIIAYVGLRFEQQLESVKDDFANTEKIYDSLVTKRVVLYDEIGKQLNKLFNYYMFVGKWKEYSPPDIIKIKRDLDA